MSDQPWQHENQQFVAMQQLAYVVGILPLIVLVFEAVDKQRLRVDQRTEHPAVDVGESGRTLLTASMRASRTVIDECL